MGTRYTIEVKCPSCATVDEDVYYAPTCGFVSHACSGCGVCVDLAEYTGISYEDASNADLIEEIVSKKGEVGETKMFSLRDNAGCRQWKLPPLWWQT